MTTPYRVGAATGFAGDRFEPARVLAESGDIDALVYECLAERTIGLAQQRRGVPGAVGYDELFLHRLDDVLPVLRPETAVLTNAGAADPTALARAVAERLDGHPRARGRVVAAVTGDDILDRLPSDTPVLGTELTIGDFGDRVVSANAYIGAGAAVEALHAGADVVITGRMGDAALFAAPIAAHHGWDTEDADVMAVPTLVGHLLECGGQLTGGYFADGGRKVVPHLATLGFPIAEVDGDSTVTLGKVDDTGGLLTRATVIEQLLYEIDDPSAYKTPDVTLDLRSVRIEEIGPDRVRIVGERAAGKPDLLKASVGIRDGYLATGSIAYGGLGALARAELALAIVTERWEVVHGRDSAELRLDLLGYNALQPWARPDVEPAEVCARFALRTWEADAARALVREVEALYTNGPAGGGGVQTAVRETTGIVSVLVPRDLVQPRMEVLR